MAATQPNDRIVPLPLPDRGRIAVIDIGSNSIRLVVFDEEIRTPGLLFNEKVMAGLGRGAGPGEPLDPEAMERAVGTLRRYRALAAEMGVTECMTVATAAVRDASNGRELLDRIAAIGLPVRLLSGSDEANLSGLGVLSAIPEADGLVGDLGGGSLELARISGGEVRQTASFPLGVLRVAELRARGKNALRSAVAKALKSVPWVRECAGLPLYLVGGSWRSLARLDMIRTGFALPIVHHYTMAPSRADRLVRLLARLAPERLAEFASISTSRIPNLADGAAILSLLVKQLSPSQLVISAYGLREGLLYERLDAAERALDPLIEAARQEGERQGRFAAHGDLLARWIAPAFAGEDAESARLRHAACLLADTGWRAHPEFRAERGLDMALHANCVGIDASGRARIAQALFTGFGGGTAIIETLLGLASRADLEQAARWGLAIRLGQRFSGGVETPLEGSRLEVDDAYVTLSLDKRDEALLGEAVGKRLRQLAESLGRMPEMVLVE